MQQACPITHDADMWSVMLQPDPTGFGRRKGMSCLAEAEGWRERAQHCRFSGALASA